jgi:hypothetical protein
MTNRLSIFCCSKMTNGVKRRGTSPIDLTYSSPVHPYLEPSSSHDPPPRVHSESRSRPSSRPDSPSGGPPRSKKMRIEYISPNAGTRSIDPAEAASSSALEGSELARQALSNEYIFSGGGLLDSEGMRWDHGSEEWIEENLSEYPRYSRPALGSSSFAEGPVFEAQASGSGISRHTDSVQDELSSSLSYPSTSALQPSQVSSKFIPISQASASASQQNTITSSSRQPLSSYTCPICFGPPRAAVLTPCGHLMCGSCLFASVQSARERQLRTPQPGMDLSAICPVCRRKLTGWDGKGGGVIPLEVRQVITV